jgi:Na+/H+ antiporter NhaC
MADFDFGVTSLLPPLLAILLAIVTRKVVPSLFAGILIGVVVLTVGEEVSLRRTDLTVPKEVAANETDDANVESRHSVRTFAEWLYLPIEASERFFWKSLADEDHLRVFAFTMLMGAMVCVIQRGGGMHALVMRLAPLARSRRGGQLTTWMLGLIVFFDDYANTLLLGNTMRPLADRLKISREKLAYLVDSTAAPVSGLALISTWVASEIGYIDDGLKGLHFSDATSGLQLFIDSIPYRFYVLFALLFVPIVALLGRDFGPMLTAERRAVQTKETSAHPKDEGDGTGASHWLNAVVPVCVLIVVTLLLLLATSSGAESETGVTFWNLFNGDSYLALVYGSLAGLLTAAALLRCQRILSSLELSAATFNGARSVLPALTILWFAWSLSGVTESLGTGEYVGSLLEASVPIWLMPTLVFVLASLVAFSTGTSWGTMAILMPLVVRTTYKMLSAESEAVSPYDPIMIGSIGSVLAGAIFGDHCSPISDTTVLSSQSSGCDHVAHVRTQMPYALLCAAVAIVFGTLPVGFGISPWIVLPLGVVALLITLRIVGSKPEEAAC